MWAFILWAEVTVVQILGSMKIVAKLQAEEAADLSERLRAEAMAITLAE